MYSKVKGDKKNTYSRAKLKRKGDNASPCLRPQ